MVQLIINDDQARLIADASGTIEVCDKAGRFLGRLSIVPPDDIEAMKRTLKSNQPRYTTQQVIDCLNSLEAK